MAVDLVWIDSLRVELNEIFYQISKFTKENLETRLNVADDCSKLEDLMSQTITIAGATLNCLQEIFNVEKREEDTTEDPLIKLEIPDNLVKEERETEVETQDTFEHGQDDTGFTSEQEKVPEKKVKNPCFCEKCGKFFTAVSGLKRHLKIHSGVRAHKCKICSQTFTLIHTLKRHQFIHTGLKPHSCKICGKAFADKGDMKKHQKRVHNIIGNGTGETQLSSEFVEVKSRSEEKYVNEAEKEDTSNIEYDDQEKTKIPSNSDLEPKKNKRPFRCDECGNYYRSESYLKRHKKFHTEEKPYKCDLCLKSYKMKAHLKRHNYSHTGEKPYCCELCTASFSDPGVLKNHKKTHTITVE